MPQDPDNTVPEPTVSDSLLDIRQLNFSYPFESKRLTILKDVNFQVQQGDTVAILGPSGSGKTSLLLLLAGLEQPDSGSIFLDKKDLVSLDSDKLADMRRDYLGIVFQSFHLMPSLTALGNVMLPLEIAQIDKARELAESMLARVGLADRAKHFPAQLSGGEQQRVAIARSLVHRPRILLADEPTGNLDSRTGSDIIELLFSLNQEAGASMILVTHDEAIASRCQRIFHMHDGELIEGSNHALAD